MHELAARLGSAEVPPALQGRKLSRISANELIAGARYTGMWQQRARELIELGRSSGALIAATLATASGAAASDLSAARFVDTW